MATVETCCPAFSARHATQCRIALSGPSHVHTCAYHSSLVAGWRRFSSCRLRPLAGSFPSRNLSLDLSSRANRRPLVHATSELGCWQVLRPPRGSTPVLRGGGLGWLGFQRIDEVASSVENREFCEHGATISMFHVKHSPRLGARPSWTETWSGLSSRMDARLDFRESARPEVNARLSRPGHEHLSSEDGGASSGATNGRQSAGRGSGFDKAQPVASVAVWCRKRSTQRCRPR